MTDRAKRAKPMGRRAYGYSIKDGKFTVIEEEAEVVREIFTKYVKKKIKD